MVTSLTLSQPTSPNNQQLYDRKIGLLVGKSAQGPVQPGQPPLISSGIDLSAMRIVFHVLAPDVDVPPAAIIRVYNLSDATAKMIFNEFQVVILQAGYVNGPYGIIFNGTIKQAKRGRESAIDSYVEIYASDLDQMYNFAFINETLAAGSNPQQRARTMQGTAQKYGGRINNNDIANNFGSVGGVLPRGKVFFGLLRDSLSELAASTNTVWSIQNGEVRFIKMNGYQLSTATVLNARTGLVLVPEATDNGIIVDCLLNPNIKVGGRVQINNKDINATNILQQNFPSVGSINTTADVTNDGYYKVLVVEHEGDSRGNSWYSHLTCLSIDNSSGTVQGGGF